MNEYAWLVPILYQSGAAIGGAYIGTFFPTSRMERRKRIERWMGASIFGFFVGPAANVLFLQDRPTEIAAAATFVVSMSAWAIIPVLIRRARAAATTQGGEDLSDG